MRKITILNGCSDGTHSDFENLLSAQIEKHLDTHTVEIVPLCENNEIYLQEWPKMKGGSACMIQSVQTRDLFYSHIKIG